MIIEFIFRLLYHGAFPIAAWEKHIMRLNYLHFSSFWELTWFRFLNWHSDWLNGRIWGSNSYWKVGTVSISHCWVAVVGWAIRIFVIERIFLFYLFNNFFWSRSFVEKIFTCKSCSFRLNSETEVGWAGSILSGAKEVVYFLVIKTLFILIARVEVADRTFLIVVLLIAHFVDKVNWWEAFWFQESINSVISKFIVSFLVKHNVF